MKRMDRLIARARSYVGVKEIKGPKHNNIIIGWLDRLGAWWSNDETPWCGVFMGIVMLEEGQPYPTYYMRAKAWLEWGKRIPAPVYGCVVIFGRNGGGHVGFVVGQDTKGRLLVLGGNQADEVNVRAFPVSRVLGYRIPREFDYSQSKALPVYQEGVIPMSTSEA